MSSFQAPRGFRDFFPENCALRNCSPTPSWGWRISGPRNMKHLNLFKTITDEIKSQVDDPGQMKLL